MSNGVVAQPLTNAVIRWVLSRRDPEAVRDTSTGRYALSYPGLYLWSARIAALVFAGFGTMSTIAFRDDMRGLLLIDGIFGLFLLMAIYVLYEARFVKIGFSEEGIVVEKPSGQSRVIPWTEISSVTYSETANAFCFRSEGAGSVRISIFRNGLRTFADFAGRRMPQLPSQPVGRLLRQLAEGSP